MFWLMTLPFRIVFGVLFGILMLPVMVLMLPFMLLALPFLILRFVFKVAVAAFVLPLVLIVTLIGVGLAFIAVIFAVAAPLLPFAFIVFCVWAIVKAFSRPRFA